MILSEKFHPLPHKKSTLNNFYVQWKKIRTFDTITYILLTEDKKKKKTCFHAFGFSFSRYGPHSNPFPSPFIMDILTLVLRKFSLSGILLVPIFLRKKRRLPVSTFFDLRSIFLCVDICMCVLFSFPHWIESWHFLRFNSRYESGTC